MTLHSMIGDDRGQMVSPIPGDYDSASQHKSQTGRHNQSGGFMPVGMSNNNNNRNTNIYNSVDGHQQSVLSSCFSPNGTG